MIVGICECPKNSKRKQEAMMMAMTCHFISGGMSSQNVWVVDQT